MVKEVQSDNESLEARLFLICTHSGTEVKNTSHVYINQYLIDIILLLIKHLFNETLTRKVNKLYQFMIERN